MGKHVVMIIGDYYPEESPTGKVADTYVSLLDNARVDVICMPNSEGKTEYTYKDKYVYTVEDSYICLMKRLSKRKIFLPLYHMVKLYNSIHMRFVHPRVCYDYSKNVLKKLEEINSKEKIDCIFSVSAPMAGHVAAMHFCEVHHNVKWVACTLDSYTAQNKLTSRRQSCFNFEKAVLAKADRILLSEELYASMPELYKDFQDKCFPLPYLMPEVDQDKQAKNLFPKERINLVYAGRFYKKIRNPEYLLKLVEEIDDKYLLHLFWGNGCVRMVNSYADKLKGKILLHGYVDADKIQEVYNAADVLVSVGNSLPEYKPSKTFEYIASGKPILNIYYEGLKDDTLEKYPLALQIGRDTSIKEASHIIQDFVGKVGSKTVDRETIEKIYKKHSISSIKRMINQAFD